MHPFQRGEPKDLSARLLRQPNLLRDLIQQHGLTDAATREDNSRAGAECDLRARSYRNRVESGIGRSAVCLRPRFILRPSAVAARASLHISHLIRGR